MTEISLRGVRILKAYLGSQAQSAWVEEIRGLASAAPFFRPETRRGQRMSVRMTSAGTLGWVSDRRGYRYEGRHPAGGDWPPIPARFLDLWRAVVPKAADPDTALVNFYAEDARMGMHQDRDEAETGHPVVSVSLGDDALFRVGNLERGGKTESLWLHSGDVCVLDGPARMVHHGVDRIRPGSSTLLPKSGRINVTLRVAGASS